MTKPAQLDDQHVGLEAEPAQLIGKPAWLKVGRCCFCMDFDAEKYPNLIGEPTGWPDEDLMRGYRYVGDGKCYHCYAAFIEA